MIGAYPLTWPIGWPRTPEEKRINNARFRTSAAVARDELMRELDRFGAERIVISTDVPTRADGLFYATAREPDDPGVAVYFQWRGRPFQVACDTYRRLHQNVRALGITIEAWRAIERHGATQLLERVVSGFSALPPSSDGSPAEKEPEWWEVLGVPSVGEHSPMVIASDPTHMLRRPLLALAESLYKEKLMDAHPDRGGSTEIMQGLNRAIEKARRALGKGS